MKQLIYKLGIGIFIFLGYGLEQGHTSQNKQDNWEDHLTGNPAQQAAACNEGALQRCRNQIKEAVSQGDTQGNQNFIKAFFGFLQDSHEGKSEAQGNLAFMYMKGWGTEKLYEQAHLWAQKGALQNDPGALRVLGTLYKKGRGVEKSIAKATEYFEQSAELGYAPSQNKLGCLLMKQRDKESEAVKWLQLAAEQNHPAAQRNLGYMYLGGLGIEKSNEKGVYWYEKAATRGNASAQNELGCMYAQGKVAAQSFQRAAKLYQLAVDQNYLPAIPHLARAYLQGRGVKQSFSKALELYQKAADRGCAESKYNLALMYKDGQYDKKSFEYMQEAAAHGHILAQYDYASQCEQRNELVKAHHWYQQAANQNYEPARDKLKEVEYLMELEAAKKAADELKKMKEKNAEKSAGQLAKEIKGEKKTRNKRKPGKDSSKKRIGTPSKEGAKTITTSAVPLKSIKEEPEEEQAIKGKATDGNEKTHPPQNPQKVKHSSKQGPQRQQGRMIVDIPLSSSKSSLEKKQNPKKSDLQEGVPPETTNHPLSKENPSLLKDQPLVNKSPHVTHVAPETQKKNEPPIAGEAFLKLSSSEKEKPLSPETEGINESGPPPISISMNTPEKEAHLFTPKKTDGFDELQDSEDSVYVRQLSDQIRILRARNMSLNTQYGRLSELHNHVLSQYIEALKYIEVLEKDIEVLKKENADLQKQNGALSGSSRENSPREL